MRVRVGIYALACVLATSCSDDAGGSGTDSSSDGTQTGGTSTTTTTQGTNTTPGTTPASTTDTTDTTTTAGPTTDDSTTIDPSGDVTGFATTDVDLTTGPDLDRVTNGLAVLYRFYAGGGTIIEDVSGVGSPLPLSVTSASAVEWGTDTLTVLSTTRLLGTAAPDKISNPCESSQALSLEVWVRAQSGSATNGVVMTLATDLTSQAFTMLQQGGQWAFRLNAGANNPDGLPELVVSAPVQQMSHVVYTRTGMGAETVYVDGEVAGTDNRNGNFNGWPAALQFSLAADPLNTNRFLGEYGLAAVYCRALSAGEVTQNFNAGY